MSIDETIEDAAVIPVILLLLLVILLLSAVTAVGALFWFVSNHANWYGAFSVLGAVVVVVIAIYRTMHYAGDTHAQRTLQRRMADIFKTFREQRKTAFVVGYTGETGKELVKELARTKLFSKVTLIGRRKVDYGEELLHGFNVEQKYVDFEKLDETAEIFNGYDVGYCCLGGSSSKDGIGGLMSVDHDYVLKTAELAKIGGTKHFHLVSSRGADPKQTMTYFQIKGLVEEKMKAIGFDRLSIYRPGLLMCDREETRVMEWILRKVFAPVVFLAPYISPGFGPTPTATLAKAMVYLTATAPKPDLKVEIFDGRDIYRLSVSQTDPKT